MTTLTLTPRPETASVLLEVAGAPTPGALVYGPQTFDVSLDSWAAGNAATSVYSAPGRDGGGSLAVDWDEPAAATSIGWAERTVGAGALASGSWYRVQVWATSGDGETYQARVEKGDGAAAQGDWVTVGTGWTLLTFDFEADATSQLVYLAVRSSTTVRAAYVWFDDVEVRLLGATPLASATITRTDANGIGQVRLYDGQDVIGGAMTVVDYEAALTGLVRYDLVDGDGVTTTAATTLQPDVAVPWLGCAVLPSVNAALELVLDYSADRDSTTTVHTVIGRADRVATVGRLLTRTGRLRLGARDHAEARRIEDVYASGEVVLLRQPTHARFDLYHVATRTGVVQEKAGTRFGWWVDVDYVEVAAPTGPLLGSLGWTMASVAAHGTFEDVAADFATFGDLVVGP